MRRNKVGSNKDPIWSFFQEVSEGGKCIGQKCMACDKMFSGRANRLKAHYSKCSLTNKKNGATRVI